jgi:molybdopterin molybdotransferase
MRFRREPIKVKEAQARMAPHVQLGPTERVPLLDSVGRRLAEDIEATHPVPHFRRSGMDGFAVRSEDTKNATRDNPALLRVIEHIPCGAVPKREVQAGTCSRIMTGAAVPDGADAVIMLEMTDTVERDGVVYTAVKKEMQPGENTAQVASDLAEGTLLMERGRKVNAGEAALLATFGYNEVNVYRRPTAAIFATGSELLPVNEPLQPGKIRNSNSYMLAAQVQSAGGVPRILEMVPDDVELAMEKIVGAFDKVDVVITTGGVSVGDYDILVDIFQKWDGELLFNKVAMRPGSPTSVGIRNGQFLFGLSGNPGACFVGFELFVRPVLWGLQGKKQRYLPERQARLAGDYTKRSGFQRFVRGTCFTEGGQLFAQPVGVDKSGIVSSIKDANCLIVVPPGGKGLSDGEIVTVVLLDVAE